MSKYRKFVFVIVVAQVLLIVLANLIIGGGEKKEEGLYRVEAGRVEKELMHLEPDKLDLSQYQTITAVEIFDPEKPCKNAYVVSQVNDSLYRIEYKKQKEDKAWIVINGCFVLFLCFTVGVLWYVGKKMIKPFQDITELPAELAKGNLSVPIREEKSHYYGKFLWGMDMLRKTLEDGKEKELELQREKKTLILSLTHDIKTPLSAIDLSAKALRENLYEEEERRREVLEGISKNAHEIGEYVSRITEASKEDFLKLTVHNSEVFLGNVMNKIQMFYEEKLGILHTHFQMEECPNCLVKADADRLQEVLQNVLENAIKYGDGKRIDIFYDEEEDCKLIHICNSGCSLKESELTHVFESFYRGSNSEGVKGSGLGLYICRSLMRKMDGDIYAKCGADTFETVVVVRKI